MSTARQSQRVRGLQARLVALGVPDDVAAIIDNRATSALEHSRSMSRSRTMLDRPQAALAERDLEVLRDWLDSRGR